MTTTQLLEMGEKRKGVSSGFQIFGITSVAKSTGLRDGDLTTTSGYFGQSILIRFYGDMVK